jgi:hypothetical protein
MKLDIGQKLRRYLRKKMNFFPGKKIILTLFRSVLWTIIDFLMISKETDFYLKPKVFMHGQTLASSGQFNKTFLE